MTSDDVLAKLEDDPNFINSKRFDFSLEKLQDRYPSGCPERVAAAALGMTEEQFKEFHAAVVQKLRFYMNVKSDE